MSDAAASERADSVTLAVRYERILSLLDGIRDRLGDIREEAERMADDSEDDD